MTVKERAIHAIQLLPEDADYQAVSEQIAYVRGVDEGLQQAREDKTLTAEQVREKLSRSLGWPDYPAHWQKHFANGPTPGLTAAELLAPEKEDRF